MRTLSAGIAVFRRSPAAVVPIAAEGLVGGLLIATGVFPDSGASAAVGAAFPLDVFFDLKQALAQASSWPLFALVMALSVATRSGVLAATVWFSVDREGGLGALWRRAASLTVVAAVALLPSAVLMFAGVASRYAPFIWVGAVLGFFPALVLVRRAVSLDAAEGSSDRGSVPEGIAYLAYAYLVALFGAAMSSFGEIGRPVAAAVVVFTAPFHALIFLGWREHARNGTYPGGGALAAAVTVIAITILLSGTIYDRYVREFPPVAETSGRGTLMLLGGVDSTDTTGALSDIDFRRFGYPSERTVTLSYTGPGEPTTKADTRGDLSEAAVAVAEQIAEADPPVVVLGHSQAGLIIDRLVDMGLETPERSTVLAAPPPFPPQLDIPPPDETGPGKPGGDLTRGLAFALDTVGLSSYDVDTESFPTNLEPVVLLDSRVGRLSVWALGDSVWLDRDWRRPGETNVVALTDHVGVVNNGRAVSATRQFFTGGVPAGDEATWRGAFVSLFRHAFAPWRPSS